jgi:hypothetical protein
VIRQQLKIPKVKSLLRKSQNGGYYPQAKIPALPGFLIYAHHY